MLFPVQLVTQNMKDEHGEFYVKTEQDRADQTSLLSIRPQRPKLVKHASSSSSIRSWSSKSSFGRSMTNIWDAMPVYNTNMRDPNFIQRRDGGSYNSSLRSSPRSSRPGSTAAVPSLASLGESA